MENKRVGYMILGISALVIVIIFLFNNSLRKFLEASCDLPGHGASCPMYDSLATQTYLSLVIVGILVVIGLALLFSKPDEKIVIRNVERKVKKKEYDLSELKSEEKKVFNFVKGKKTIFQADLIEEMDIGKVKMSRILDRLEGRGLVERKRRGMTNVVVLKG